MTPFLKWVGGKRWLVDGDKLAIPKSYNRYIEPFLGGGAVYFKLAPKMAILSDLNASLIETYVSIRDNVVELEALLKIHAVHHSDEYYYEIRSCKYDLAVERSAQFIYLNRTCFNGIYRENLRGEFNVPRGSKNTVLFANDDFVGWSKRLQTAALSVGDFETTIDMAQSGDFVFADPPYTVRHNKNGFIKYNQKIFSWSDQQRLAKCLQQAADRGVNFILTNADHEVIRELYAGFEDIRSVGRSSVIAASAKNRSLTTELVVTTRQNLATYDWVAI